MSAVLETLGAEALSDLYLCGVVVEIDRQIAQKKAEIEQLRAAQQPAKAVLMRKYGVPMLESGQKSKSLHGEYRLKAGVDTIRICECHSATNCDAVGTVTFREWPTGAVWLTVKPLDAGGDE